MNVQKKHADLLKDSLTEYYKSADKEGFEIISDFTGETVQVLATLPKPSGYGWSLRAPRLTRWRFIRL